jgi:hypothetical protein
MVYRIVCPRREILNIIYLYMSLGYENTTLVCMNICIEQNPK